MLNVFISGITKQSGKTLLSSGLAATMQSLSYSTSFYKPIQTSAKDLNGFKTSPDLVVVKKADPNIKTYSTYVLFGDNSPFTGAYEDKVSISTNEIFNEYRTISNSNDCNIVEGCNSISTPIAEHFTEIDLVKTLNIPLVLVINPKMSNIDDSISALNYITSHRGNLTGVIINKYDETSSNIEEKYFPQILKEFTGVKIIGTLPDYGNNNIPTPDTLIGDILTNIDIEKLFGIKIQKLNP